MSSSSSILGKVASGPLTADQIEVWELSSTTLVEYATTELSALCPVTRQPDIYTASISYRGRRTLESKGMKHYLWSFRDEGVSCEALASRIAHDLSRVLDLPVTVSLRQQVRGGLVLSATVEGTPAGEEGQA